MAAQFASGADLVEVYATVVGHDGEPVSGLTRDDFIVAEDGLRRPIVAFAAADVPLALAVAVDRSFSMSGQRLSAVVRATRGLLAQLREADQAMLVAIGSENEVLAPLSADHAAAQAALDRVDAWGTTPLYDATRAAIDAIQPARGRRALVLVSDGVDRYSSITAEQLIAAAREKDVLIYPVSIGKQRAPVFTELAAVTGARSFAEDDLKKLPSTLDAIVKELRAQYLIGYTPPDQSSPSQAWHSIEVRVNRPDVRVRARDGYRR